MGLKLGQTNYMAKKDNKEKIEKVVKKLLSGLNLDAKFEVLEKEEEIEINFETEDTGMVIGYHGDTLESLQLILSLCIAKELKEFKRVSLEIGGYKKQREEWLNNLALESKDRAINEGREIFLRNLKSWERRIIHLALKDDESVLSESVGEGRERMLVIKPR